MRPATAIPLSVRADGFYWRLVLLLGCAGVFACFARLPLAWDGAYQFVDTLQRQTPYTYRGPWPQPWQGRFQSWPIWWPVVWASKCTDNLNILGVLYGLPLLLAPALSLALCWWIVRRAAPSLILWALFGVAIGTLPGQAFVVNDTIFLSHLIWPVFLAMFVPLTPARRIVIAVLVVFQWAQPIGILYCFGVALAALLGAATSRDRRAAWLARAGWMLAASGVGVMKVWLYRDPQAASEASIDLLVARWYAGVAGRPLWGMVAFWIAAAGAGLATYAADHAAGRRSVRANWLGRLSVLAAAGGGIVWTVWASDARHWQGGLDFRRFVLPLSVPFFAACTLEGLVIHRRGRPLNVGREQAIERRLLPATLAIVFALVLVVQSTVWLQLLHRLKTELDAASGPLVSRSELAWVGGTPLDHWSLPSLGLALSGRRPTHLIDFSGEAGAALDQSPPKAMVADWERYPIGVAEVPGYYDFSALLREPSRSAAGRER